MTDVLAGSSIGDDLTRSYNSDAKACSSAVDDYLAYSYVSDVIVCQSVDIIILYGHTKNFFEI